MEPSHTLLSFCKALAEESRLKIVGLLASREHSVQELAALLKLKEPTVSHHLSVLKTLDLVTLRADGTTHWYRLDDEVLRKIGRRVFSRETLATLARPVEKASWGEKVLRAFVDGERLIEIPVAREKRRVILRWLLDYFDRDETYSEAQVNAIIKRHHPDCATLRREFIGAGMMTRDNGVYRRTANPESRPGAG